MKIIVDGYNLAHSSVWPSDVSDAQRDALLVLLNRFAKQRRHTIQVVFDGGKAPHPYTERYSRAVSVTYSGWAKDADTYIKQVVSHNQGKELLVVTSDNDIARSVSRYGMVTVDSEAFLTIMHEKLRVSHVGKTPSGPIVKTSSSASYEVDTLMFQALQGVDPSCYDTEEKRESRTGTDRVLSKDEKKLKSMLDKL